MQLSLTYYSLAITISFCKFWFENDTLIHVRYCHLLSIWCVFNVIFFLFFFDFSHDKIDVDIYLKIFGCILVYIHIRFNNLLIRNVSCSFLLHIKYEDIKGNI